MINSLVHKLIANILQWKSSLTHRSTCERIPAELRSQTPIPWVIAYPCSYSISSLFQEICGPGAWSTQRAYKEKRIPACSLVIHGTNLTGSKVEVWWSTVKAKWAFDLTKQFSHSESDKSFWAYWVYQLYITSKLQNLPLPSSKSLIATEALAWWCQGARRLDRRGNVSIKLEPTTADIKYLTVLVILFTVRRKKLMLMLSTDTIYLFLFFPPLLSKWKSIKTIPLRPRRKRKQNKPDWERVIPKQFALPNWKVTSYTQ